MTAPDHDRPRDGGGQFIKTQESAERDAKAARMRSQGWSFQRISDDLGYGDEANVRRALKELRKEAVLPAAQELVSHELAILDHLIDRVSDVLAQEHLVVQHGRVVLMGDKPAEGEEDDRHPLIDHDPILKAAATLQRLTESRRKLLGLDSATKLDVTSHVVDPKDLAIQDMISAAKARNALTAQQIEERG